MIENDTAGKPDEGAHPGKPRKKKSPYTPEQRAKADELMERSGIPRPMALQVASGQMTLNDALTRLMRKEQARKLAEKEGIELNEAFHVLSGKVSVEQLQILKQLKVSPARQPDRSVLVDLLESGAPAMFHRFGHEPYEARVVGVEKYDCTLESPDGEREELQKHELKLAAPLPATAGEGASPSAASEEQAPGPTFSHDAEVAAQELGPSIRFTDRFRSSKRVLFRLYRDQIPMRVTFRDGEQLEGYVGWHGKYEYQLLGAIPIDEDLTRPLAPGHVVIFRHAMQRIDELPPAAPEAATEAPAAPEAAPAAGAKAEADRGSEDAASAAASESSEEQSKAAKKAKQKQKQKQKQKPKPQKKAGKKKKKKKKKK
jgi:hypothetical protein